MGIWHEKQIGELANHWARQDGQALWWHGSKANSSVGARQIRHFKSSSLSFLGGTCGSNLTKRWIRLSASRRLRLLGSHERGTRESLLLLLLLPADNSFSRSKHAWAKCLMRASVSALSDLLGLWRPDLENKKNYERKIFIYLFSNKQAFIKVCL